MTANSAKDEFQIVEIMNSGMALRCVLNEAAALLIRQRQDVGARKLRVNREMNKLDC